MGYKGLETQIPLGDLGLMSDPQPGRIPPGGLIVANNIVYDKGIQKSPGSLKYNSTALDSGSGIAAIFDFWPNSWTQNLMAATKSGKIFKDEGDKLFRGGTAIKTGLNALTTKSQFVEGGTETEGAAKKLFLFSQTNQVQVLSGTGNTFATMTNPAADWTAPNFPTAGLIYRNRLWAFKGHTAYASTTGDHEDFVAGTTLLFSIFPGEGGDIVGGHVFNGRLFIVKENNQVYYLVDSDTDNTKWFFQSLGKKFSLSSPNGLIEVRGDVLAGNESGGVSSLAATEKFGDVEEGDLLSLVGLEDFIRENSAPIGADKMHAEYYKAKKYGYFTFQRSPGDVHNRVLFLDASRKDTTRFTYNDAFQMNCLTSRINSVSVSQPIYGDDSGFVQLMDREDRLVNGAAFTATFQTGHIDFRHLDPNLGARNKLFDWYALEFVEQGTWTVSVDVYIDGRLRGTNTIKMKNRSDNLDTFTLGTDKLGRGEAQRSRVIPISGTGKSISWKVTGTGANQNFHITQIICGLRGAGYNVLKLGDSG